MTTIRIHVLRATIQDPDLEALVSQPGWQRWVTSTAGGATPVFYWRPGYEVMWGWSPTEYKNYLSLRGGSTIVVELEDDVAEELFSRLNRNTIDPSPAVV